MLRLVIPVILFALLGCLPRQNAIAQDSTHAKELAKLRAEVAQTRADLAALMAQVEGLRSEFDVKITTGATRRPDLLSATMFADGRDHMLTKPLRYQVGLTGPTIEVPEGFVTDLASVPQLGWSILPPAGYYASAAVVHDYLYWTQACTKAQADRILYKGMRESEVNAIARNGIYRAVAG